MAGSVDEARSGFGEIRVDEACPLKTTGNGAEFRRFRYTWFPERALENQLRPEFKLTLQCLVGSDGIRRFYPWTSFEEFLAEASTGGLAILAQRQRLSAHQRHSYRAMRLLFLRVHRMAEHFRHRFDSSHDLSISPSGRGNTGEKDILPDEVGLNAQGRGRRWSVGKLIEQGRKASSDVGYSRPSMAVCIHFGLLEAARRNPLPLDDAHVPQLIRGALFSSDPIDQPSPELVECVTERLLSAIHQHLDDDSQAFDKWFLGPKNSVVHQLAKQKHSRGGELLEEDVRHALLHLGWQAYEFAANSIHAQMRTFQNAMPEPLADREKLLFEHMHLRQPYLGNFPSVLLAPRFGLIKGLLWELWEKAPDLTLAPIFYRLLDFYSTMATRRRAADRRIKRPRSVQFDERFHSPSPKQHQFQEIAGVIREMQKIDCGCPRRVWWAELKGQGKATVCIVHRCMACEFEMETTMRWEEFSSIARASL